MRAMRGKTLETVPFQPYFGCTHRKLPQSTVKLVLPSNESYESKTGCNRTLATVLWVPLTKASHIKASHPQSSAFSAFSCPHFPHFPRFPRFLRFRSAKSPQTLVFLRCEGRPHFPHFPCVGFESLISKIRPTGFRMTGLR